MTSARLGTQPPSPQTSRLLGMADAKAESTPRPCGERRPISSANRSQAQDGEPQELRRAQTAGLSLREIGKEIGLALHPGRPDYFGANRSMP